MSDVSASSSSDHSSIARAATLVIFLSVIAGCTSNGASKKQLSDPANGGASGANGNGGAPGESGSAGAGTGGNDTGLPPERLSEAGLYENLAESEALAEGVVEYRPRFELWADGAEKRRFLFIPPGAPIDTRLPLRSGTERISVPSSVTMCMKLA